VESIDSSFDNFSKALSLFRLSATLSNIFTNLSLLFHYIYLLPVLYLFLLIL